MNEIVEKKPDVAMYSTWTDQAGKLEAFAGMSEGLAKLPGIYSRRVSGSTVFRNIGPGNTSVRDGFNRLDYEAFRFDEASPTNFKDLIKECNIFSKSEPIVYNTVSLMAEFVIQGMDFVHEDKKVEQLYKSWFKKINGLERSERFVSILIRLGQTVALRKTAEISREKIRDFYKAVGEKQLDSAIAKKINPDMEIPEDVEVGPKQIPWKYTFINPATLENMSDELMVFTEGMGPFLGIELPDTLIAKIKYPKDQKDKDRISKLPADMVLAIRNGNKIIPLPEDKTIVYYYKKDDWDPWAYPMISCVLNDLRMLRKMKLADLSALDGAISKLRVWKLGDLDNKIAPTAAGVARLAEIIMNAVAGGVMDIIWGPAIDLVETKPDLHQFLGDSKYAPVLNSIRVGMGIPTILAENSQKGGFTNNFIELKTFTERLQYCRNILKHFWEGEIELFRRALDLKKGARVVFDRTTLTDETTELNLLMSMYDRNLISMETLQERMDLVPEVEQVRIKREFDAIDNGELPKKAGPWYSPESAHKEALQKIALQQGFSTPQDFGIEATGVPAKEQMKGEPGQGRPPGKKDSKKRKTKVVKPRSKAQEMFGFNLVWAENTQKQFDEVIHPVYLQAIGKANMRQLTNEQANDMEEFKFAVLCNLKPGIQFDSGVLEEIAAKPLSVTPIQAGLLKGMTDKYFNEYGELPLGKVRQFQSVVYAITNQDELLRSEQEDLDDEDLD